MPGDPAAGGRILLKLSGELLAGPAGPGLDPAALAAYAGALVRASGAGWRPGVVLGGGNIIRGGAFASIERNAADLMGMLATVVNALAMKSAVEDAGGRAAVFTALPAGGLPPFRPEAASDALDAGMIVLYAGGTGNSFLTTDTAAALRAVQTGCSMLLKGTKVDGIYDSDPLQNPSARRFDRLTWDQVLGMGLRVMDAAAVAVCRDSGLPIVVFDVTDPGNIERVLRDPSAGTVVGKG